MFEALQEFTASLPDAVQWLGVMLVAAIPFIESYFGSVIGIIAGINPVVAIIAAIVGNTLSMFAFVFGARKIRERVTRGKEPVESSPRRERLRAAFNRWGVPGVSLLGQTILPSQVTAVAMVSFGAKTSAVILWNIVSIVLWGVAFGLLTALGFSLVTGA